MKVKISKKALMVLALLGVVVLNYANIFQNDFAWDDKFFIVDNIHIRDMRNIPAFFAEPSPGNLYRPLRSVFYTLTYSVWRLNVFGYHLNSLMLHFLVTLLLFLITLKITNNSVISFAASLLFTAHPIHTARITNMTAAFDVFGIVFMLTALFFYILFSKNGKIKYAALSIASYCIALFSSEEALTLILLLFLYEFSFNCSINMKNARMLLKRCVPYIIVTFFYLAARWAVLHQIGRGSEYFGHTFLGTMLTTLKVFAKYIIVLLLPTNLTIDRVVKFETSVFSVSFLAHFALLLVALAFFAKSHGKQKLAFFSIGWFFITLLPFSNIFPQITIMAERYLYLPSYGFCLFLAFLIFSINRARILKHRRAISISLVILITATYTILTIQRNAEWRDDFTLLNSAVNGISGTKANNALALYYRRIGDYENAEKYATKAIMLGSKNYKAYENLATIYAYQKRYNLSILYYKKAIGLKPDFYLAHNNLGLVYSYMGNFNNSLYYLKKAIEINPRLSKAYNDIGIVYAKRGEFGKAIENINKAIDLNPYDESYRHNLAVVQEFIENSIER
jgi:Tfp pilus assembly protein PilF